MHRLLAALLSGLLLVCAVHPTASAQDKGRLVIHEQVEMGPHLPARTIRVYLPPGYDAQPDRRWPVLYLHDGQNLFDDATAYAGEWQVDETIDRLVADGRTHGWIVVGIDNAGEQRLAEYAPWPFVHAPEVRGSHHAAAVAQVLKPWIDRTYRTDPSGRATLIGGSSMGALIALYTAWSHPDRFGGVLAMSGSWVEGWFMPDLRRWIAAAPRPAPSFRVYLDMGESEWDGSASSGGAVRMMDALLRDNGLEPDRIRLVVDPAGRHREADWARRLPDALLWLQGTEAR